MEVLNALSNFCVVYCLVKVYKPLWNPNYKLIFVNINYCFYYFTALTKNAKSGEGTPDYFHNNNNNTSQNKEKLNRAKSFSASANRSQQGNNSTHLKKRQSSRKLLDLQDSSAMIAEIRNVTVLFIKIDIPNMELLVDSNVKRFPAHMEKERTPTPEKITPMRRGMLSPRNEGQRDGE